MSNTSVSQLVSLSGFFTTQLYLQGQSLREIELRLGFDSGRLSQGAWFATPTRLPGPDDFDFAGYSQVAGHHTKERYGDLNAPGNNDREKNEMLQRKRSVISQWGLFGTNRLIKVIPMIGHSLNMSDDYQYPPGSGIPQWKIRRDKALPCKGICFVSNYPNGKFIPDEGYFPVKYK